jgi:hypothetical protein
MTDEQYNDDSSSRLQHFVEQQTMILRTIQEAQKERTNLPRTEEKLGPKVRRHVGKEQSEMLRRIIEDQQPQKKSSNNEVWAREQESATRKLNSFGEEQGAIWNQIQNERYQSHAKNVVETSPDNKRKHFEGRHPLRRRSRQRLLGLDSFRSFGRTERRESLERAQIAIEELGLRSRHEHKSEIYHMAQQLRASCYANVSSPSCDYYY